MNEEQKREHVTRLIEEAVEAIEYLTLVEYADERGLDPDGDVDRIADALGRVRVQVTFDD